MPGGARSSWPIRRATSPMATSRATDRRPAPAARGAPSRARSITRCGAVIERAVPSMTRTRTPTRLGALELLRAAAAAAVAKKAREPIALDLRDLGGVCDYFFICSGSSEVQVKAIAEHVEER